MQSIHSFKSLSHCITASLYSTTAHHRLPFFSSFVYSAKAISTTQPSTKRLYCRRPSSPQRTFHIRISAPTISTDFTFAFSKHFITSHRVADKIPFVFSLRQEFLPRLPSPVAPSRPVHVAGPFTQEGPGQLVYVE